VATQAQESGIAEVDATAIMVSASAVAAWLIWVMTTQPESLVAALTTADDAWSAVLALAGRLLDII